MRSFKRHKLRYEDDNKPTTRLSQLRESQCGSLSSLEVNSNRPSMSSSTSSRPRQLLPLHILDNDRPNLPNFQRRQAEDYSANAYKRLSPMGNMVLQPWKKLRGVIASILKTKAGEIVHDTPFPGTENIFDNKEDGENESTKQKNKNHLILAHSLAVTIPYGFQLQKVIPHSRDSIRSVLPLSTGPNGMSEHFAAMDSQDVHIWKGSAHLKAFPLSAKKAQALHKLKNQNSFIRNAEEAKLKTVYGLDRVQSWVFIERYKIYVVSSSAMQLRVLNERFETLWYTTCKKGQLSIKYVEKHDEVILTSVGDISVWKVQHKKGAVNEIYYLTERMTVPDILNENWVNNVYFDKSHDIIIACIDNGFATFDYKTGERIDDMPESHDMNTVCCTYYEPLMYTFTASKDGVIKVWNAHNMPLCEFRGHIDSVTSLLLLEPMCEMTPTTLPAVMSASLDGTIRVWNFETGSCVYQFNLAQPCLGMGQLKKDIFYTYSHEQIWVWNVNRLHHQFLHLGSRPIYMNRFVHPRLPPRVLVIAEDGTMRVISPVTGCQIFVGFPAQKDIQIIDTVYDMEHDSIYCLTSTSDIIKYDVSTNPMRIAKIRKYVGLKEDMYARLIGIDIYNHPWGKDVEIDTESPLCDDTCQFRILVGTHNGQIIEVDLDATADVNQKILEKDIGLDLIVQAHSAPITAMKFDSERLQLYTVGKDMQMKIWQLKKANATERANRNIFKTDVSSRIYLNLQLKRVIVLASESISKPLTCFELDIQKKQLAVVFDSSIILFGNDIQRLETSRLVRDEDNTAKVVTIANCSRLGIWASTSPDGVVKVWDSSNVLLREIQFHEKITSITFANDRGDLLVGTQQQVSLIQVQDYLPTTILKKICFMEFDDDKLEAPHPFDHDVDFWEIFREQSDTSEWHVRIMESIADYQIEINDSIYFEPEHLATKDVTETLKRKHKREFLQSEKHGWELAEKLDHDPLKDAEQTRDMEDENEILELTLPPTNVLSVLSPSGSTYFAPDETGQVPFSKHTSARTSFAIPSIKVSFAGSAGSLIMDENVDSEEARVYEKIDNEKQARGLHQINAVSTYHHCDVESKEKTVAIKKLAKKILTAKPNSKGYSEEQTKSAQVKTNVAKEKKEASTDDLFQKRVLDAIEKMKVARKAEAEETKISIRDQVDLGNSDDDLSEQSSKEEVVESGVVSARTSDGKSLVGYQEDEDDDFLKTPPERALPVRQIPIPAIAAPVAHVPQPEPEPEIVIKRAQAPLPPLPQTDPLEELLAAQAASAPPASPLVEIPQEKPPKVEEPKTEPAPEPVQEPLPVLVEEEPQIEPIIEPIPEVKPEEPEPEKEQQPVEPIPSRPSTARHVPEPIEERVSEVIEPDLQFSVVTNRLSFIDPRPTYVMNTVNLPQGPFTAQELIEQFPDESIQYVDSVEKEEDMEIKLVDIESDDEEEVKKVKAVPTSNKTGGFFNPRPPSLDLLLEDQEAKLARATKVKVSLKTKTPTAKRNVQPGSLLLEAQKLTAPPPNYKQYGEGVSRMGVVASALEQKRLKTLEKLNGTVSSTVNKKLMGKNQMDVASVNVSSVTQMLKDITTARWFPQFESDLSISIRQIINIIIDVIVHGPPKHKIMASRELVRVYKAFRFDITEVFESLVKPQFIMSYDNDWRVRLQFCLNLPHYKVYNPKMILVLLPLVMDDNEDIRKAALYALQVLGISSRDQLRLFLSQQGVISRTKELNVEEMKARRLAARQEQVHEWVDNVIQAQAHGMVRQASVYEHLNVTKQNSVSSIEWKEEVASPENEDADETLENCLSSRPWTSMSMATSNGARTAVNSRPISSMTNYFSSSRPQTTATTNSWNKLKGTSRPTTGGTLYNWEQEEGKTSRPRTTETFVYKKAEGKLLVEKIERPASTASSSNGSTRANTPKNNEKTASTIKGRLRRGFAGMRPVGVVQMDDDDCFRELY